MIVIIIYFIYLTPISIVLNLGVNIPLHAKP